MFGALLAGLLLGAGVTLALDDGTPFNQLWGNGSRLVRAREPELGSFFLMQAQLPAPRTGSGFVAKPADVAPLASVTREEGAEAVVYDSWMAARRALWGGR